MSHELQQDLDAVASIKSVPTMLDILCRTTGMRFAAVARVTEHRWIACSVRDEIDFGLKPGGELEVESTICHEIRQNGKAVIFDNADEDPIFAGHHTPRIYRLKSYISIPIILADGSFFGTLCAIDPEPHSLNTPENIAMFEMFASVIGFHLSSLDKLDVYEARLKLERQNSALREEFIAVLGHDLRNPLAGIDAGMTMLGKTPLTDKAQTIVKLVQSSVERMANLIDNVVDFTRGRLGGGLTLLREEETPLEPLLRHVVSELRATHPDREILVDIELGSTVNCDKHRIGQVLSNLLGNALTHGAKDRPIRIGVTAVDDRLELFVANAGVPIPAHLLETIFEPFSRGKLLPGLEGLGLGLYISKQIALAHKGRLDVSSTEAETRFTFSMPLRA